MNLKQSAPPPLGKEFPSDWKAIRDWLQNLPPELQPPEPDSPRGRILTAATMLFSDQGLSGASTRAIAEAARVNLAMVHYYYGSKEQLYERVLASEFLHFRETILLVISGDMVQEEMLITMPVRLLESMRKSPSWVILMRRELAEGAEHMVNAFKLLGPYGPIGLREMFTEAFHARAKEGRFRNLDPDALREMVMSIVFGTITLQPFFVRVFGRDIQDEAVWSSWKKTVTTVLRNGLMGAGENQS